VDVVEIEEIGFYKGQEVTFKAIYEYCNKADEFLETEEMIRLNKERIKNAYENLLKLV